jgi:hypothetical protein
MSYGKVTSICGIKGNAPAKPTNDMAKLDWFNDNVKVYQLRGHWNPEKALAFAVKRGLIVEKIEHQTLDYSGKGRGGVDHRFAIINGVVQAVQS